jgi:hypothetical protein
MYGNQGGFTPSGRFLPQTGGKGGAGGGKGGGQIQQGYNPYAMYDPTREVAPGPDAIKDQTFAESARLKEQARLEAERLAGRRPNEVNTPLRPRR